MQKRFVILVIFCLISWDWASQCGFSVLAQQPKHSGSARILAKQGTCNPEDLYDSVQVDTTRHFRVIYTQKGPHAVIGADSVTFARPPYIDTLMRWLEAAYTLEVDSIGMRAPQGPEVSYHYHDHRFSDKFPVEIIDIDLLRDTWNIFESGICGECYGLTYPDAYDPTKSTLFIDNDFLYQNRNDPLSTYTTPSGGTCSYSPSTQKITTTRNGKLLDYTQDWATALRITAFHELYHTTQLRYQDYNKQYHFWFEASAVGVEELGAPDVNDYWQYLPPIFSSPQTSLLDVSSNGGLHPYGEGVFYQYLEHRFGLHFDPPLWERLSKAPTRDISLHFDDYFNSLNIDDGFPGVFADFSRHLAFSGSRSKLMPADSIWAQDLPFWPELATTVYDSGQLPSAPFSFRLFLLSANLVDWIPSASSGLHKQILSLNDTSYALVSTGFASASSNAPANMAIAFPNPWRGTGILHFQLSTDDLSLEIRDASGQIITILNRSLGQALFDFDGQIHQKALAPGLYYWRGLSEKRLHRFLVVR